jgi:Dynein associated protein
MNLGKWNVRVILISMFDPVPLRNPVITGCDRIQAQFNHLAETYFKAFDFDLGERELGLVLSLDHDLDVYASSMGLTKTAVEAILNDEGGSFRPIVASLTT